MIITDLFLPQAEAPGAALEAVPGIERVGRFGARCALADGWRPWLARWLGREDLAHGGCHASLSVPAGQPRGRSLPRELDRDARRAGRGTLERTPRAARHRAPGPPERRALCDAFARTFGGSGLKLWPLSGGDFLIETPGIEPLATPEPARCLGGDLAVPAERRRRAAAAPRERDRDVAARRAAERIAPGARRAAGDAAVVVGQRGRPGACAPARGTRSRSCFRRRCLPRRTVASSGRGVPRIAPPARATARAGQRCARRAERRGGRGVVAPENRHGGSMRRSPRSTGASCPRRCGRSRRACSGGWWWWRTTPA